MGQININLSYPFNEEFYYETMLTRVNLDERRKESIANGRGFVINTVQGSLKKNLKDPNSIFSTRYGQMLQDINPFADRYKCDCGFLTSRIHAGIKCHVCNTKVKYVDDDFGYFGWMVLKDPYYIIHPNIYKSIEAFIGQKILTNILIPVDKKDENGFSIEDIKAPDDEPFFGIGMMEFKDRYLEILEYYRKKSNSKKEDYYRDLLEVKDITFTQSIPVYTTHLRPFKPDASSFHYEDTNEKYTMMSKLVLDINNDTLKIHRKKKQKKQLLYDLHIKLQELYKLIEEIISGKRGEIRKCFGGRYNFTSRSVIGPDPSLRIDEVYLPYVALVELMQQTIVNLLQKSYNISYADAYSIWKKAQSTRDERVYQIIKGIINDPMLNVNGRRGIPILINRNPTIAYGGILQMFVVGINDSYTMSLPNQILPLLAGDYDGDVLNILYIINKSFYNASFKVLNPRNRMYVSANDGKFNNDVNHTKDTLINLNSLLRLSRTNYSQEQLERLERAKHIR